MVSVDLKSLFGKLNPYCTQALEGAAGLCLSRTNYEISVEHFLTKCVEDIQSDIPLILRHYGLDVGTVKRAIDQTIDDFRAGNAGKPVFSPRLPELIQDAWLISSIDLFDRKIRSGALLLAFLSKTSLYGSGGYADLLKKISRDDLQSKLSQITLGSLEQKTAGGGADAGAGAGAGGGEGAEGAIGRFCEDFTAKAKAGKIDPVFGRDAEIRQMVDILARRRKNNPIAVGDPGVGKTAVVEGLALRIVQNDVPEVLQGVTLIGLDMGLLQAGASVKGEFEKRLKGVIDEIKASTKPIILFIDEAHTLIGAGGQAGGSDAANLLKPALARGELRTIAATTWAEYKKYFEKDAALARRFQLVKLDEPSVETTVNILRGLRDNYEKVHNVVIRDDAIHAAANLSSKYIMGRQQPDKGVDLLDTAAARVKVSLSSKPGEVEDKERLIQSLKREKDAMLRDKEDEVVVDEDRLKEIDQIMAETEASLATITARWKKEQEAGNKVLNLRRSIWAKKGNGAGKPAAEQAKPAAEPVKADTAKDKPKEDAKPAEPEKTAAELAKDLTAAMEVLAKIQEGNPMVSIEVDPDVVAKVVSDWTGVPLGKLVRDEAKNVLALEQDLQGRIKGQDHAIQVIAKAFRAAKSGLKDPSQPMGIFLLVGPSGVGKTETALSVADMMFGGEQSVVTVNLSEFQEKHTVSKLIGSPPGYVGYGEGGVLTEAVRHRPYSVVLLDECEKAHPDILNLFYQVFDKGTLSDGEGREIDFKNTVIFMTSNLATDVITELCNTPERPGLDTVLSSVRPILNDYFKPALLARMNVTPYYILDKGAMGGIVKLKLNKLAKLLHNNNKMKLEYGDKVVQTITDRCTEVETGARNIDYIIRGNIMPRMSTEILGHMTDGAMPSTVAIDVDDKKEFTITFK